jgi:hypothetical protein
MTFVVPPTLEDRVLAGDVGFEVLLQLAVDPENVTLFKCQKCGVPRPYFAIYDTRGVAGFDTDWTCESDVAAVRRSA